MVPKEGEDPMARYICPSCGAEFNGKKCKNCNYEALEWHQSAEPHPLSPSSKSPAQPSGPSPVPRQARPNSQSTRKRRRARPRKILLIVLGVIIAINLLEYGLIAATRRLYTPVSHSDIDSPAWEEPTIPPLSGGDYQLLYEDNNFTVLADCGKMWTEGIVYVTAENRTNRPVEFFSDEVILNDRLCSLASSLYFEAEEGSTGQGIFYLEPLNQEEASVYPAKVSFRLYACDDKTYDTLLLTDPISLTAPGGELVPIPQPEGTQIAKGDGMQLFYISWEDPEDLRFSTLRFGMVNDTDRELSFYCDSARANGEDVNITLFCTLPPHTVAYDDAYCLALADLDITSMDQLESLELTMGVFDEEAPGGVTLFPAFSVPIP